MMGRVGLGEGSCSSPLITGWNGWVGEGGGASETGGTSCSVGGGDAEPFSFPSWKDKQQKCSLVE